MARTLDPTMHALRRDEFIDAAQRLITTKGYEQLSVQEILDELGASKGAFYHYFDSKAALLEAVVDRMTATAIATFSPIVDAADLPAPDKLRHFFADVADWKLERKDLVLEVVRVWYSDENAIMRDKFRAGMRSRLTPLLTAILRQGAAEGSMRVSSPEQTAGVVVSLLQGAGDAAGRLFLDRPDGAASLQEFEDFANTNSAAMERVLGLAPGSFPLIDPAVARVWHQDIVNTLEPS